MLGIFKATQDNPKETWRLVPLQDFTSASDIDWTQEIEQIDRQLYRKYGLTPQEIAFIEEKVKPMRVTAGHGTIGLCAVFVFNCSFF